MLNDILFIGLHHALFIGLHHAYRFWQCFN